MGFLKWRPPSVLYETYREIQPCVLCVEKRRGGGTGWVSVGSWGCPCLKWMTYSPSPLLSFSPHTIHLFTARFLGMTNILYLVNKSSICEILLVCYNFTHINSRNLHCKSGSNLNSHLTPEGRKQLNWVQYASPGAHSSEEKQRNRKVQMCLMWCIFDTVELHTIPSRVKWELRSGPGLQCSCNQVYCADILLNWKL